VSLFEVVVVAETEGTPAARPVRWPIYAVLGLIVAAVAARLVFMVGIFGDGELSPAGVSESKEGEQWTFTELLAFLHERGVPLAVYTSKEKAAGGPVLSVCPEDHWAGRTARLVHIQRRASAQESHEAGTALRNDGFAWGRFLFTGEGELLDKVEQHLHPSESFLQSQVLIDPSSAPARGECNALSGPGH
jgi:hypothetical protein